MTQDNPKPAVKAFIEKNNKILVLKIKVGDDFMWTLPGGKIENGEAPLEALHREIDEETSMQITVEDCAGMYHFFTGAENHGDQVVLTVFRASTDSHTVDINSNPADEEIEGYQWVKPEKLLEKNINENLEKLIKNYYTLK